MSQLLEMHKIDKVFPGVKALSAVDFTLKEGEIHALMGENGAGKSTLIKVLTGVHNMDVGHITLNGKELVPKTPLDAQKAGIATVYQEVNLCTNLSVAENIYIGNEKIKRGCIAWEEMNRDARALLSRLNLQIDVSKPLEQYSLAVQQMIAIARALSIEAKVLILDEPTSSLDEDEVAELFKLMRQLKKEGLGIVFVTHFLDQVYEVCDSITVLRNGQLVGSYKTEELPKIHLVSKMIGKELDDFKGQQEDRNHASHQGEVFIEGKGIGRKGKIKPLDIQVRKGEVLGFPGLLGAGRTETARLLFGADKLDSGMLSIKGKAMALKQPIDALKKGIALCPEDRKKEGVIGELTVRENIILALQARKGWYRSLSRKEQENFAMEYIKALNIKTPHSNQLVKNLSGGNQQKVILGRWLLTHPELLILDEPTRGIDVGTKVEIQKLIIKLAGEGMGIVFISSELDEMIRCCNRMLVFRDHQQVGELSHKDIYEKKIMETIAGGELHA